jgi:hypothetical protein
MLIPVESLLSTIAYRAHAFGIRLYAQTGESNTADSPRLRVAGEQAGTWHLTIAPGIYAVGIGGDGCSWSVTVRKDQ